MSKLKSTVHVHRKTKGGREDVVILGPDDEVPDWAEPLITNPDAWLEPPATQSSGESTGRRAASNPPTGQTPTQN